MGRKILAVILGIVVAMLLVALTEFVGHKIYPLPADLDFTNYEQVKSFVQTLPLGALLFVLLGWGLGSFFGGLVAGLMSHEKQMRASLIVGGVILAATIVNLVIIPSPIWFAISGVILVPLLAFFAGLIATKKATLKKS